jgi:hypothetical protein
MILKSLTSRVALAFGLVGMVLGRGMLIFAGELGERTKRMCYLCLVLGMLLSADLADSSALSGGFCSDSFYEVRTYGRSKASEVSRIGESAQSHHGRRARMGARDGISRIDVDRDD